MEILLATNNLGKVKEMKNILSDLGVEVFSLKDKGISIEVEEDGTTFEENSMKKACEVCKASNMICVADDSGLEVDYLNGAPGVYSARYGGEGISDTDRYKILLKELEQVEQEKRTARFVSVISIVYPDGEKYYVRGECEGYITTEAKGEGGFGYDPVFYSIDLNKTFGEATSDEKNKVSHRARALELLKRYLANK